MVVFLVQGHNTYTHSVLTGRRELCNVQCRSYDWILGKKHIPPATYVFTDRERMDVWDLRVLSGLYAHLQQAGSGFRVVNNPAAMMNRRALLRTLYMRGINDFNAYAVTERVEPTRFPVFLRREFDHAQPLTGLLDTAHELEAALAALRAADEPEEGVLIIEYCAQPVAEKLFRKLSAYRVGDRTFFYNTVHENSWLVKYGTVNGGTDALYDDERQMIETNAFRDTLDQAFDIAGVDYGRADFGMVDGRVQIYEINTNPTITAPGAHPNPIRGRNQELGWDHYCNAINALDTAQHDAPSAQRFKCDSLSTRWSHRRKTGKYRIIR